MRLFALLLLFTAVCPALAADADVKAASVAYVDRKVTVLEEDIRNELSDGYLTKDAASKFLTSEGGTVTGVLNVPTPTLPTE